jgi:soluble lytic murein transglycosylase-like protein
VIAIDEPLVPLRSPAELAARRARRHAHLRRRRAAAGLTVLAAAVLAVLPVMAASAGTSTTLPAPAPAPAPAGVSAGIAAQHPLSFCPIPAAVRPALVAAADHADVELALLAAVAGQESRFDPAARSGADAQGLMQLEPSTASAYGDSDPYDMYAKARAGASYLHDLLVRYQGSLPLALAAYNAGPTAVDKAAGVPDYPETIAYVANVSAAYQAARFCR